MSASALVTAKIYACCRCGARSYHRMIGRDRDGAMRPTGLYRCSGCSAVFADPRAWRDGGGELRCDPDDGAAGRGRRLFPTT
jgi:DNA-directed RNA polymerase subunit RPC12/RpoP